MDLAHYRIFHVMFSSTVGPNSIPLILAAYKKPEMNLVRLAVMSLMKKLAYQKSEDIVKVLQTENFDHFREFIVLNSPRSSLFYYKNCLFSGYLTIHITSDSLTLMETHLRENHTFLQMRHSERDGYSRKTINKFLKISAAKDLFKVVVRVPVVLEKTVRMTERMNEYAAPYETYNVTYTMGDDLMIVFNGRRAFRAWTFGARD